MGEMCESENQKLQINLYQYYCLICSQSLDDTNDNDVYHLQNIPNLIGSEAAPSFNDDLALMFALKLLNFPLKNCADIFQKTFGVINPGQWFLLCGSCCNIVEEAFSLQRNLAKLNHQLTTLKSVITNTLKNSFGKEEHEKEKLTNSKFNIPNYIRSCIKKELAKNVGKYSQMILPNIRSSKNYVENGPAKTEMESDKNEDDDTFMPTLEEENVVDSDNDDDNWNSSNSQQTVRDTSNPPETIVATGHNTKSTKSRRQRKIVITKSRSQTYECALCPFTTTGKKALRRHQSVHDEVKTYQCKICNCVLSNQTKFEFHMRKHKRDKKLATQEKIKCGKCDFISRSTYQAEIHISTHVAEFVDMSQAPDKFICKICQKSSENVTSTKQHISKEHKSELGVTLLQCDMCPNTYITEQNLRSHIRLFHRNDECQHRCDQCGAGFNARIRMEDHRAKHFTNGEPHLVCDLCGLKFASHQGMRNHKKRYHAEKKPGGSISAKTTTGKSQRSERSCSHCDIVCVNLRGLKEHWKSAHPELYKFKCNLCEAAYISRENLKIHVRCEHLKEKVECAKCGAKMSCASIKDHNRKYCKFR